jgi:DNA-binding GntR family transcriptional regulator
MRNQSGEMKKQPLALTSLAQKIITSAIKNKLRKGSRLTELSLTEAFGLSRTPVRKALRELAGIGFLKMIPNKGYYLIKNPEKIRFDNIEDSNNTIWLYEAIARDRNLKQLPELVQENQLLKRYGITRGPLKRVLTQIAEEGWIVKSLGYGWRFLPMIDTLDAYRDSYELRGIIAPEAILSPRFNCNSNAIQQCLEEQVYLFQEGYRTLSNKELVKTNAEFHETIAAESGNRFFHQTIQRLNKLRLVLEMFLNVDRERVKEQTGEHIAIIKLIIKNDQKAAARKMKEILKM